MVLAGRRFYLTELYIKYVKRGEKRYKLVVKTLSSSGSNDLSFVYINNTFSSLLFFHSSLKSSTSSCNFQAQQFVLQNKTFKDVEFHSPPPRFIKGLITVNLKHMIIGMKDLPIYIDKSQPWMSLTRSNARPLTWRYYTVSLDPTRPECWPHWRAKWN